MTKRESNFSQPIIYLSPKMYKYAKKRGWLKIDKAVKYVKAKKIRRTSIWLEWLIFLRERDCGKPVA